MSRLYGLPVQVVTDPETGEPRRFLWRGVWREVEVIGRWHIQTRWWDAERQTDRYYFRVMTKAFQPYEIYREATSAGLWVLDKVLD